MTSFGVENSLTVIVQAVEDLARATLIGSLQPGLESSVVRARLASIGLGASQQVEALYGWRNGSLTRGINAADDIHLFPGFYMLSLEDATANYAAFRDDRRWNPSWLPIFANGGGDFYVADFGSKLEPIVRHFRIDESEHPVEFGSLSALCLTLAEAYARGIFYVDDGGYLEMDDLAFAALAGELNPEIPWWRE